MPKGTAAYVSGSGFQSPCLGCLSPKPVPKKSPMGHSIAGFGSPSQ